MAADFPHSLDLRELPRARPSARRTPRLSGRWAAACRLPRVEVVSASASVGSGVNPFAFNPGVSPPNPFLSVIAAGVNGDALSAEAATAAPFLAVPGGQRRTTSSVSTPSSPRFLQPDRATDSAHDAGKFPGDAVSGVIAGPAKRRRSVHVDGSVQASGSTGSTFSGFRSASLRGAEAFDFSALASADFPSSLTSVSRTHQEKNAFSEVPGDVGSSAAGPSERLSAGQGGGNYQTFSVVVSSSTEEPKKPPVYIDSGCYSLCYHTSMTMPPPALSLGSLPTPVLDKDREARRRRKACMSVLRSVQSSLGSTPESSPSLRPLPDPQGEAVSAFSTPPVALPSPPPAVRQPFFPSAFQTASGVSSSLCPSWSSHARRCSVASTSSHRSSHADEPVANKGDRERALWPSLCHPGAGDSDASSSPESPASPTTFSPQQLRLRPDWFSPCTLGTLIGACVHAYDELRAAFPPPEPAPRVCLLSLPALYEQLPPHLKTGAVLLDAEALALGSSSAFFPIECSQCVVGEGKRGAAGPEAEETEVNDGMTDMSSQDAGDKRPELPAHLHGQFDIIVCDTKTVTVAALENTAACIRALCRRRTPKTLSLGPQESNSVDAAAEALSGLSLHGRGAAAAAPCRGSSVLPPFCRVLMISTCLLSPVVDDLLGLHQSPFQPYVPSSALSSLQLQCIYSNFSTFPGLQKHNTVDFSTRVRVKSTASRPQNDSGAFSGSAFAVEPTSGRQESLEGSHGSILCSDAMVARALVLQSEEEQRSSCRAQESGTADLCSDSPSEHSAEIQESERQEARLLSEFNRLQLHGCPVAQARAADRQCGSSSFLSLQSVQPGSSVVSAEPPGPGRSKACRGITMRSADDPTDDGIDYELECGSHFGMVAHEL
ncbi:hypothetical protein TGPRC2_253910 [Toxoplasma gondii TgCatPRC2]|uniref:Uncharacterized protein n=1 Tax=Toxoplasma gondii TgCatPRC2 TaxID=1130821 RepID=A0A151HDI7_TOXGO|nr:hypothetical protein TGPRC2_253910 [Toxoplasma gondii TgCatPRC2]